MTFYEYAKWFNEARAEGATDFIENTRLASAVRVEAVNADAEIVGIWVDASDHEPMRGFVYEAERRNH